MSKPDIYRQHDAAFNRVAAFIVMSAGTRVATVALKFPADGAGRLYAYTHWLGLEMTRGQAGGYGYDKRTAAVESAVAKGAVALLKQGGDAARFADALKAPDGRDWSRKLEDAGFTVLQAV